MSSLANQYKAINVSQGFPNFECSPRLQGLVTEAMQKGYNQYAPMTGLPALCEQIAIKNQRLYQKTLNPATEITITVGASQAIFTAITALIHEGDEVILIEPCYDCYQPAIELCGGKVVVYETKAPDFKVNWVEYAQLITSKTRMILINNPQNPSASIFTADDWREIARLTKGTDIFVLSDEVYEHIVFDGNQHQSVFLFPELWERTMAVYSFGKTFHNTGWKVGYIAAPEYIMREIRKVHQFNVFSVFTPVQHALAEFLKDENEYLNLSAFFQEKRDLFCELIAPSRFTVIPCKGTYFQLLSYAEISDESDVDFAQRLVKEHGIATIPISGFYNSQHQEQLLRICFAKTDETLRQAAACLNSI
jgi:methionine aminotransferase